MATTSSLIKTLTSFSGADLVVTFANQVIGELQQISWAIQREKAPVFTLGSSDPRSFSRGKRGIAGSMVFAVFDQDALMTTLLKVFDKIAPVAMFTAAGNAYINSGNNFEQALDLAKWNTAGTNNAAGKKESQSDLALNDTGDLVGTAKNVNVPAGFTTLQANEIQYADMLPPFDVTMTFANEYGQCAFQKIYDMDILNEGSGVSVDTIVMERQMTYIARKISPIIKGIYNSNVSIGKGLDVGTPS